MLSIKNRIEKLKNRTTNIEVRKICEEFIYLAEHGVPETKISTSIRQKLNEHKESDATIKRFIINEKRLARLQDMGITRALDKIISTAIYERDYLVADMIEKYGKLKALNEADYTFVDDFVQKMNPYRFDPIINEAMEVVCGVYESLSEEVHVMRVVDFIEKSNYAKFFEPVSESLREYVQNKSVAQRASVISYLSTFEYEPIIKNLVESLKVYESRDNKGKFNVIGVGSECEVSNVYSFILVEKNSDYFSAGSKFFKKVGQEITEVSESSMNRLNSVFVEINKILLNDNISIIGETINYSYGKNVISIDTSNNSKRVLFNENELSLNDTNMKMLEMSNVFTYADRSHLNIFNRLYEYSDTLCDIDFAKKVSLKNNPNVYVVLMKTDLGITAVKNNPYMNESVVYQNLNGNQVRNLVLEFLNYDISQSLVDFLSEENKQIAALENERRAILDEIDDCELAIKKIDEAQNNHMELSGSDELYIAKREVSKRIFELKNLYQERTLEINKLKTFEGSTIEDENLEPTVINYGDGFGKTKSGKKADVAYTQQAPSRDFGIGDMVDTAEYGVGKVTGVNAVDGTANVIFNDGSQKKLSFDSLRIASNDEIEDEEMYADDLEDYKGGFKKKSTSTYVQEIPKKDFSIGQQVTVAGKGVASIIGIDSVRHVAIVMLQGGKQSEEEFGNLTAIESEEDVAPQTLDNSYTGIDFGLAESENSETDDLETVANEDGFIVSEDVLDVDSKIAKKWKESPHIKYLSSEFVDDVHHVDPENTGREYDIEYEPETNEPEMFMSPKTTDTVDDEYNLDDVKDFEKSSEPFSREYPVEKRLNAKSVLTATESDEDYSFSDDEVSTPFKDETIGNGEKTTIMQVDPSFWEEEISGNDVIVDLESYNTVKVGDRIGVNVEFEGINYFVPKEYLISKK